MENNKDVHEAVSNYAGGRAAHILNQVTGKSERNIQIDEQNIKVLKRGVISSVASLTLGYRDLITKKEKKERVLIKYFGKSNGSGRKYKDFAQSTIDVCDFLSRNEDFPDYYFSETTDMGTFLTLQQIGDVTLHEVMASYKKEEIRYLLQSIFPYVSRFQIKATENQGKWINKKEVTKEKLFNVFGRRQSATRILDYLRAIKEKEDIKDLDINLRKEVLESTVPISKIYTPRRDSFRVTHGDLITKNIISKNERQGYSFIDAEPLIGSPISDLSALLATPGIDLGPIEWKALTELFVSSDTAELSALGINLNPIREELVPKLQALGIKFADDEPPGNLLFYTFMGLFFRSGRISAKVRDLKRHHPRIYERMLEEDLTFGTTVEEMRKKMSLSLGTVVNDPGPFEISRQEYVDNLTKLYEIAGNEGAIDSQEIYLTNNKNIQNGYKMQKNPPYQRERSKNKYNQDKLIGKRTKKPDKSKKERV